MLTEAEIEAVYRDGQGMLAFARAIETLIADKAKTEVEELTRKRTELCCQNGNLLMTKSRFAEALQSVIDNDKTEYGYRGDVDAKTVKNSNGYWPPDAERWKTPMEIAQAALNEEATRGT